MATSTSARRAAAREADADLLRIASPVMSNKGKIFNPGDEDAFEAHLATLDEDTRTATLDHLATRGAVTGTYEAPPSAADVAAAEADKKAADKKAEAKAKADAEAAAKADAEAKAKADTKA